MPRKCEMRKIAALLLLFSMIAGTSYAINIFEKTLYKHDVIKMYGAKILVNPLTGQAKYVWCRDSSPGGGFWTPLVGLTKRQYQSMYDRQNARK